MKGPAISPTLYQQVLSKLSHHGSEDEYKLGSTLKRMFAEKRLTRMWIDAATNQVYVE